MDEAKIKEIEEIRALLDANTGPRFGYTYQVVEVGKKLLSALDAESNLAAEWELRWDASQAVLAQAEGEVAERDAQLANARATVLDEAIGIVKNEFPIIDVGELEQAVAVLEAAKAGKQDQ